ncbi:hypothetical protein EVAR_7134_1 [Eumeta japonica]|uniref:Uncharacterized protein n=1 Tax=Eumeta variegata TaxID=151549 RepID=A0A4C1U6H4_EUMVA|nr:hypothetical protein EVAR_7134_1 [Eumeta japonica]
MERESERSRPDPEAENCGGYTVQLRIGVTSACGTHERQVSDRRSFSVPSRLSIVEFLRSGRSGDPPLHYHSQRRS